jgi:polysaccharide export outer membrane protein
MQILIRTALLICAAGAASVAQQSTIGPLQPSSRGPQRTPNAAVPPLESQTLQPQSAHANAGYILGPGDQISARVLNVEEINDKPVPIDLSGDIRLPGLTATQVEAEIAKRLKGYVLHPDVSVTVAEFRSQPVSVLGAVKTPGIQQVQGSKTLYEMLSLAGGLDTTAGPTLKITRRLDRGRIPLPNAKDDPTGQFSVAEVSVKSILDARNPAENILVQPNDVISIPRADTIYVLGQVQKAGGFVLNDREDVTALQALSMAGGLDRASKPKDAKIMRRVSGSPERTEIAVDLNKILDGKTPDVRMQADDIVFIPSSVSKKAGVRALEAAVQMGTGLAIWRIP